MSATGAPDDAAGVGSRLASEMLAEGAADLMHCSRHEPAEQPVRKQQRMTRGKTSTTPARQHDPDEPRPPAPRLGRFVGSGPGDPGLLTVRAATCSARPTSWSPRSPSTSARPHAARPPAAARATAHEGRLPELVDGGFGEDGQPLTHAARAKVVVKQAKRGRRVVRLMAGDPFVYASGPEEAPACAKAGLGFEVVPGVSSRRAVPAYAGIPLTTKDHRELTVVTCARARSTGAVTATPAPSSCSPPSEHRRHRQGPGRRRPRTRDAGR